MAGQVSRPVLLRADRGHLQAALASFSGLPGNAWLGGQPPRSKGVLPSTWPRVRGLPPNQVIDVLAASAPNHCIDSWGFAARTFSALLAGDAHSARHLAYYAQLRAALSILANVGVGVFNRINFVVDARGGIHRLDPNGDQLGTHLAVWSTLKEWAGQPNTARSFLDMVRIKGSSLKDLIELLWPGKSVSAVATSLVASWGVDLKRGKSEHTFRNESSYSSQLLNPVGAPTEQILSFVDGAWRHLEPTGGGSFDSIDRYILRSIFQTQHFSMTGNRNYATGPIDSRYLHLPDAIRSIASRDFLVGAVEVDSPDLFARAASRTGGALEMAARAVLLCRLCTAFTHTNFTQAGVSLARGALRPWLDELAVMRGFWPVAAPLQDPMELWADVELALMDLAASRNPAPACLNDWMVRNAKGLPVLAEAERVGVWSLAS